MLRDLLHVRRWAVDARPFGRTAETASRHFTEAAAIRRKRYLDALTASAFVLYTVRHEPRRLPGLLDPQAPARHRAPGRPA